MYEGADRPNIMKRFFAECSLVLGDINKLESIFDGDMDTFAQHLTVNLFNKKFAKEVSQIGGITLDRDSFADYFLAMGSNCGLTSWHTSSPIPMERKRKRPNSMYGATTETLYTLRGCVGS